MAGKVGRPVTPFPFGSLDLHRCPGRHRPVLVPSLTRRGTGDVRLVGVSSEVESTGEGFWGTVLENF